MRISPLAVAVAALAAAAPAALATTPERSTVTAEKRSSWVGQATSFGPNFAEDQLTRVPCLQPICDTHTLTVPVSVSGTLTITVTGQGAGFTDLLITAPGGERTYYVGNGDSAVNTQVFTDAPAGDWVIETYTNTIAGLDSGDFTGRATLVIPEETP